MPDAMIPTPAVDGGARWEPANHGQIDLWQAGKLLGWVTPDGEWFRAWFALPPEARSKFAQKRHPTESAARAWVEAQVAGTGGTL